MLEKFDPIKHEIKRKEAKEAMIKAEPEIEWDGNKLEISISFKDAEEEEYEAYLKGSIEYLEEGKKVANSNDDKYFYVTGIRVPKIARGFELATLLYEMMDQELQKKDIKHIFGITRTLEALKAKAKAFGKDKIIFYKTIQPTQIDENLNYDTVSKMLNPTYMPTGVNLGDLEDPNKKNKAKKIIRFKRKKKV